jgi:hypothetical protein
MQMLGGKGEKSPGVESSHETLDDTNFDDPENYPF